MILFICLALVPLEGWPPLALGAGLVNGGFFFSTLTENHILCQIKFQPSVY